MTLRKRIVSSAAALAIIGTAAIAANNSATTIATDGTGDYLVFPVYAADANGNWKTNIKVVNTNTTKAIVAKVVIREYVNSAEKLDFPIFLSPGDVWEATLEDVGGTVHLKTNDDSMVVNGVPASQSPVDTPLFAPVDPQNNHYGYIEVYGVAEISAIDVDNTWTGGPLDKVKLYNKYVADLNGNSNNLDQWNGVEKDALYGQEVLFAQNANGNLAMTLPAVAFEGVTGTDENTVRTIGQNTDFGSMIKGPNTATGVLNAITNLLAKSNIYATFYEGVNGAAETKLILTQPLKYAYGYDNTYCVTYQTTARDQEEHANVKSEFYSGGTPTTLKFCPESAWLNVETASYTKGYTDYQITSNYQDSNGDDTSIPAPIIPVLMTAKNVGGQNITNAIYPAYKAK